MAQHWWGTKIVGRIGDDEGLDSDDGISFDESGLSAWRYVGTF